MNIFYLDSDLKKCAEYHCDKHVVKMVLETTQMLCTTLNLNNIDSPYRTTHKNHPCSKWLRESKENFSWLCSFGMELCKEYTYRYHKTHKCESIINYCIQNMPNLPNTCFSEPPLCFDSKYVRETKVESYRAYYKAEKKYMAKYTARLIPFWL